MAKTVKCEFDTDTTFHFVTSKNGFDYWGIKHKGSFLTDVVEVRAGGNAEAVNSAFMQNHLVDTAK